jgi:transcriptional regulator with XRE-family HTH domain
MREQERITMVRDGDGLRPSSGRAATDGPRAAAPSRRSTGRTQDIDRHVGARIRERRIMLGLTQQQLADLIGVTYQQAHKYERGINRVSAGRLFEIARALSAPITYFYEGIGQEGPRQVTPHQRMLLEIARNFAEIRNEKHQEAVSQLARALASR